MMVNGVCVVQGEANAVVALLKKFRRNVSHLPALDDHDPLLRNFADLRDVLNSITDLAEMNYITFLSPFLEVIKSEATDAPVTSRALSAVDKFINYGLLSSNSIRIANAVHAIADSVTKAKFVGTADSGSDECVLFQILQTLRSLLLAPCGRCLTDETVCEVLQCCFRIGLESSLPELLRLAAETALVDISRLLFTRLPTFGQDIRHPYIRKLVMKSRADGKKRRKPHKDQTPHRRPSHDSFSAASKAKEGYETDTESAPLVPTPVIQHVQTKREHQSELDEGDMPDEDNSSADSSDVEGTYSSKISQAKPPQDPEQDKNPEEGSEDTPLPNEPNLPKSEDSPPEETIEPSNVAEFDSPAKSPEKANEVTGGIPHGLPCVRELLRFLIALTNPFDRTNNNSMILMGLNLLTVALEAGADYLGNYPLLMPLVKNEMCRALLQLLNNDKLPIFTAANRVCFLLFESLRTHLKFQLESYFLKLTSIITSEQLKEMALESLVILWRIPGLVTELYLNYDCGLYCSNLFEDITRLLLQNAFPLGALRSTHILSLDALLTVVDTIDHNCATRQNNALISERHVGDPTKAQPDLPVSMNSPQIRPNRMPVSEKMPTMYEVIERKKQKQLATEATELFNSTPNKAIEFLLEKGILSNPLNPKEAGLWLRHNPRLDKNKIAEYICNRKNPEVLKAFVQSFNFENTRIDEALRRFLESFRLPGESAEISKIMQHFAEHWHKSNNEPFEHVDAAFTLCYAIIMLNVDQHNPQVRRNQPPMTLDGFRRNLSGTNNNKDFNQDMLETIYHAIKNEEIVMPSEHTGLVKENYIWKVLLKRGDTDEGSFLHAPVGWNDHDLFGIIWGSTTAALSYVFDKSSDEAILTKALNGYRKCAAIAAYYGMTNVFDNLIIHLCKFSTLMTSNEDSGNQIGDASESHDQDAKSNHWSSPEMLAVTFAEDKKAQTATKTMFHLVHTHGDNLREGWKNVLDCVLHLFRAHLLPSKLVEVEDYVDPKGFVKAAPNKQETSILSWLGFAASSNESNQRRPSAEQEQLLAKSVIYDCHPEQLITDCKYLTSSALVELINNIVHVSLGISSAQANSSEFLHEYEAQQHSHNVPASEKLAPQKEDSIIFLLELMISIVLENKDRLMQTWPLVRRHLHYLLSRFGRNPLIAERAVQLRPPALYLFSKQIAFGLHTLLRANAANIHKKEHWVLFFSLLEAAGAASYPDGRCCDDHPGADRAVQSDVEHTHHRADHGYDRGYLSDDLMLERRRREKPSMSASSGLCSGESNEWIHVHQEHLEGAAQAAAPAPEGPPSLPQQPQHPHSRVFDRGTLVLAPHISRHDSAAFLKVSETLAFLARDVAHITPANFQSCIECVRKMVEASMDGGRNAIGLPSGLVEIKPTKPTHLPPQKLELSVAGSQASTSPAGSSAQETVINEQERLANYYEEASLHLLNICNNLYTKALSIHKDWALAEGLYEGTDDHEITTLWTKCWRPLLQAMARLSCDCRRKVRTHALDCLGTAFRMPELNSLPASGWEDCFAEVIFPLLTKLLTNISPMDPIGMEEIRVRVVQLVSKIFLYHLMTLSELSTFPEIISRILSFMDEYLKTGCSDLLSEAIPESLKNMVLVLENSGLFNSNPELYHLISRRLSLFLPNLVAEIMSHPPEARKPSVPAPEPHVPVSYAPAPSVPVTPVQHAQAAPESEKPVPLAELLRYQAKLGEVQIVKPLEPFTSSRPGSRSASTASSPQNVPQSPLTVTESPYHQSQQATVHGPVQLPPPPAEIPELTAVVVDKRRP
ncbi:sec7 domain-containing protein [Ditylenchus destructor]|nr:sec7 domain-containing protein [Ditylenchus destructor]